MECRSSILRRRSLVIGVLASLVFGVTSPDARAQSTAPRPESRAPSWLSGSTCYEVFVRSFSDSDGDGVGDLTGLINKLDYLNDGTAKSLGVRCLWLMPIMVSPSYHGYDVSDYEHVNKAYGTDADFKRLVAEAHKRGIRVIVDMVINHTSSQLPAFQAALRDTASPYRAWYRFSPTKGPDNRWGNNNWHHSNVRDEWYYGFFWQGMPDLNYERPEALNEMKRIATLWLNGFGVDGLRMDAVRYLVENGGQVDDQPGTHAVLRAYATHARTVKPESYTVGEVFGGNDALLPYYPGQLDAYFAFEPADSMIAAVKRGTVGGMLAPMLTLQQSVPWHRIAPFLRNHDQPRTMSELGGDAARARVASALLLTMPGVPYVYYGEELGMQGPKPDEKIRTPMAWSMSGPHLGFTTGTPWEAMNADSLVANVEAQSGDANSLLALHRALIRARTANKALSEGALVPLVASDPALVAYARRAGTRTVLVIANLGDHAIVAPTVCDVQGIAAPGRHAARDLLTGRAATSIAIKRGDAASPYQPRTTLAPHEVLVLDLTPLWR
jgi:glycosidase